MALTSASTISDAINQYSDNLVWEGDVTKARLALAAVRFILVRRARSGGISGRNWTYEGLEQEKVGLENFVAASGNVGGGTLAIQVHHIEADCAR